MNKIACGIISYLGDSEVREARWEMQWKQLLWLKEIDIFDEITIIVMEWTEEEMEKAMHLDERINLFIRDKIPQGNARNILFEMFYGSDFDWCLFLDNDAILYNQHMSGTDFFEELCKRPMPQLAEVDVILPIDPRQEPFTAEYQKNKTQVDNNIVLKLFPGMKTSFFILKNIKKHKDKVEYFDEDFTILEDYEFAVHLAFNGYGVYKSKNFVLKEFGTSISTLPYEINGGRKILNDKWLKIIYNKWRSKGMPMKDQKIMGAAFMRQCYKINQKPKHVIVPKKDGGGLASFF